MIADQMFVQAVKMRQSKFRRQVNAIIDSAMVNAAQTAGYAPVGKANSAEFEYVFTESVRGLLSESDAAGNPIAKGTKNWFAKRGIEA